VSEQRIAGFRLGIYVFKDAEIVDFAAPHGVFSVARRFDPELEAFLIADANRPVQAQAPADWEEALIAEVARVMEYSAAYDLYRDDRRSWTPSA